MARSHTFTWPNEQGLPLKNARCVATTVADPSTIIETQYTDNTTGVATFSALTDNTDCMIVCYAGNRTATFFSEATIGTTEIDNASITTAKIGNLQVTNALINDCAIGKLTAGTLTADIVIASTIKTAASPNPRMEITSALIAGYSDATTKQFYLQSSDGKAYFGAGNVVCDASGITLNTTDSTALLNFKIGGVASGYIRGATDNKLYLSGGASNGGLANVAVVSTLEAGGGIASTGAVVNTFNYPIQIYGAAAYLEMKERASVVSGTTDYGAIWTESDNELHFLDGAGTEYTLDKTPV